jgi:hypothetical protein
MSPLPFYPLCGFGSLREELGGKETARLRLKLGSARRAAPTIFFDSRGIVMRSETAGTAITATDFLRGFVPW